MLIKVRAPPGIVRTEIAQLAQIFRAPIVDVGDTTFTMRVTGDPGKVRIRLHEIVERRKSVGLT